MTPHPRSNLPEPLSGVPEEPLVELGHGFPWLTRSEINRLVRQQGIAPVLARSWVIDELVQAIPLDPALEQNLMQEWLQQHGVSTPEALEPWLTRQRLLRDDVVMLSTQAERLRRFRHHRWGEEVEIHFLRRKPELDEAIYSLLRVGDRSLAEELHQQLLDGEAEFADLAERFSEGPESRSRGLVGPHSLTTAHPEIAGRLRVGQAGQLWPPFPAAEFWVVLRLEEKIAARLNQEMRERLLHELFDGWLQERERLLLSGEPLPALPPVPSATEVLQAR